VYFTEGTHRAWMRWLSPRRQMSYAQWLEQTRRQAAERQAEADNPAEEGEPDESDLVEAAVVDLRRRFPHLGPRKLLALLERRDGEGGWPAASTIGDILKRAGLVEASRRRRRPLDAPRRVIAAEAANEEWAADFKGWFRTQDQRRGLS